MGGSVVEEIRNQKIVALFQVEDDNSLGKGGGCGNGEK